MNEKTRNLLFLIAGGGALGYLAYANSQKKSEDSGGGGGSELGWNPTTVSQEGIGESGTGTVIYNLESPSFPSGPSLADVMALMNSQNQVPMPNVQSKKDSITQPSSAPYIQKVDVGIGDALPTVIVPDSPTVSQTIAAAQLSTEIGGQGFVISESELAALPKKEQRIFSPIGGFNIFGFFSNLMGSGGGGARF